MDDASAGQAAGFRDRNRPAYSVREFIRWTVEGSGVQLRFEATGLEEKAVVDSLSGDKAPALKPGDVIVKIDPRYFRPTEVETLLGDPSLAKKVLGCELEITPS